MKFIVPSKTLYNFTSTISKVINSKNALAILNNFLFVLDDNRLSITGSDVENALTGTFEVMGAQGGGSFCIDARRIVDLLKELPDQPVTFDINEDNMEVTITYSNGEYTMVAIEGDQFAQYQNEGADEEPMTFTVPGKMIVKGIENTIFSIGTDDFHPQMMGILFDIYEDGITFVATDTRKLVRYVNKTGHPGVTAKRIVPAKPASLLKSILPTDGDVEVTMTSKSATFTTERYTFNCRFIKGNFPDYNRVIPTTNTYTMVADRGRFLNAVRRVGVFVDPGYGMEKFRITNDAVQIKSNDANMCTAGNEQFDCEYDGPEIVIGFSAPYLIEILNTIQSERVLLFLCDPSRPGVFCPSENEDGTDLLILLMPMNVNEF